MIIYPKLDKIAINVKSHRLLDELLNENPQLETIMRNSRNETEALVGVKEWISAYLSQKPHALDYYQGNTKGPEALAKVEFQDFAAIRILDYIDHAGEQYEDLNLRGQLAVSNPIKMIWMAVHYGTGGAKPYFFSDMLELFRQYRGETIREIPDRQQVEKWMDRYPSGTDPRIVKLREENRDRIIGVLIEEMDKGNIKSTQYRFDSHARYDEKVALMLEWWKDYKFHLKFAVRSPELLNRMLGESLDPDTMQVLFEAEKVGIPFFVNPYYLSLLHVRVPYFAIGADLAIRDYIIYHKQLIEEFGEINAWEKEDKVEPSKPNAAGWLLPNEHNIHRRYPEVAILIPDTMGRACGGLCASCQRMYDFQRGNLNFNLEKIKPKETWDEKLKQLMEYYRNDAQLRDILITGGDALMSSNVSMHKIFEAILQMVKDKKEDNQWRGEGEKYAEILRVRLGTRLPVYLPQRMDEELIEILNNFKKKGVELGVKQFVIQTHFESPMEVTLEAEAAIQMLLDAGWTVTNQLVFTAAASRRGHTAKLRKVLNEIGVISYYTFSVKGYMENNYNFAVNARTLQEQEEEKYLGRIPTKYFEEIKSFPLHAEKMKEQVKELMDKENLPFLASDRNVLNLPGVGKSMTFRVIGITRYGRRILEFDYDHNRTHSPIIHKMGKVIIIESKSISEYIDQLEAMGENPEEYAALYGYSIGETEPRIPVYEYPEYDFKITNEMTNLGI